MAKETKGPAAGAKRTRKAGAGARLRKSPATDAAMEKAGSANGQSARTSGDDRERRVRDRAYEIWEQEGRPSGRESEHWAQAERETRD